MRCERLAFAAMVLVAACDAERNPAELATPQTVLMAPALESEFTVIDLGTLGGSWSQPGEHGALNDQGQVVGRSETATGEIHAFRWDNGVMTDLGTLGQWSEARAINAAGLVIGLRYEECGAGCSPWHGVVWEHGVMTDLGMLPYAVNDVGQVIGGVPGGGGKGYLWERGVKTDLGSLTIPLAINNAGRIVGSTGWPVRALMWERGMTTELGALGGSTSQAAAINARGQVVGGRWTATGESHAFLWQDGVLSDLGTLGGPSSSVVPGDPVPGAINDRGQIAGVSSTAAGELHAFLWDRGVMTDLGSPTEWGCVGWVLNNAGEMIGTYVDENGDDQVFVWAKGRMIKLPALSEGGSWPAGINNAGQIVGSSGGHTVLWERRPRANAGR